MPSAESREQIQTLLSALLIARKEANTTGVPIARLDQDYREETGSRIPFRQYGHGCLVDFLQSLSQKLIIRAKDGLHYAFPVVSEKTQHVSALVAGQKHRKFARPYRRVYRPSAYYPKVVPTPMRLNSTQLCEIVRLVRKNPNGVHHSKILEFVKSNFDSFIDWYDLGRQLRDIRHEVEINGEWVYPAIKQNHQNPSPQQQPQEPLPRRETRDFVGSGGLNTKNSCVKPAGFSDSEQDDFSADYYEDTLQKNQNRGGDDAQTFKDTKYDLPTGNNKPQAPDYIAFKDDSSAKTSGNEDMLVNERTRIRLQKLIEKHPEGIWCADLEELYLKEYTIPLPYEDLGFVSVISFVAQLPEIFHCARPEEKGDFKLFDARSGPSNIKTRQRTKVPSLAALHNIYEQYVEPTEPVPCVLSKTTMEALIPEGVMTENETVAQICVTELHRGIHEYIDVTVCDVYTPSFFWIHLYNRIEKLRKFMEELHEFYEIHSKKYLLPMAVMRKGMNCACTYDGKWHRAIIKSVRPDNYIQLMFYDYGTVKSYPPESIHFLHRKFSNLPAQAIPCGLYNVKPVSGDRWPRNVSCEFVSRTMSVPLVATIASIDTENNSMMVALTNTEGTEDFHINDWMVQTGLAVYGNMGETVDMNFRPYDTEATVWETYPEQNNLSDIPEGSESCDTDFTFAKSLAKGLDIQQQMNDCMRLSGTRFKSDLEIFLKNGFSAKPDVANVFEEIIKVLLSIRPSEEADCPENDKKPRSPVPPERSDGASENPRPESKTMNHRELEVAGEVEKPQRNGFAEPKPQQKLEPHFVFTPKTTNPFPINNVSDSKQEAKEPESIDASSSSDWFASLRHKLQDSLSASGKNLFDFNANKFSEPVHFKIHDNNPFRNHLSADKPSIFQQAANNQPKNSPTTFGLFTNNSNLESQPQIVYESGPVLYNGGRNTSGNERNGQMSEIMKERQKLIESKRVNVESWIEHGANSNNNHSNNSTPFSAFQSLNNRVPNGTTDKPVYFNGTSTAPNNVSRSLEKLTSEAWLDMVASAIDFNKNEKTSSRPEISRPKGIKETFGNKPSTGTNNKLDLDNKTVRNQSHSVYPNTPSNGQAYFQDGSGRLVWSVKKILISNRFVFLIIYRNEAWMAVEEFAAAFTNMSSDTMLKILSIQRVDIPFLKISRAENCSLFNELDGTSVNVPRDCCNKIDEFLNLVPLKSALKILNKLNIVKGKQVLRATKDQVFPEESPALFDIRTVINAWGQFQQEYSLST